jgi:hypothetical protein
VPHGHWHTTTTILCGRHPGGAGRNAALRRVRWRRLKGGHQLPKVIAGVTFQNGVEVTGTPEQSAA